MAVVAFNYELWAARFPALAAVVKEPLATAYFVEAGEYCNNTDASMVTDLNSRLIYLNLLTAHIAKLNGASPAGAQGLVGRIASVTEGSVTIRTEFNAPPGSAQWYIQTQEGAQYWQMTAGYRGARYVPGDEPAPDPFYMPWLEQ